jgi:hypothetical protein
LCWISKVPALPPPFLANAGIELSSRSRVLLSSSFLVPYTYPQISFNEQPHSLNNKNNFYFWVTE